MRMRLLARLRSQPCGPTPAPSMIRKSGLGWTADRARPTGSVRKNWSLSGGLSRELRTKSIPLSITASDPHDVFTRFNRIRQCWRVATRYDKLAANYPAFIKRASIQI